MAEPTDDGHYLLVAAIDFGTTNSCYAFSFRPEKMDTKSHESIVINSNWGENLGHQVGNNIIAFYPLHQNGSIFVKIY